MSWFPVFSQDTPGCTDPQANNYDPLADYNDGSCTYNLTIYSPVFQHLLPGEVEETSGLIYWADGLWTINDSGNDPVLFKLDTATGEIMQEITVGNAENVDWEALAQDEDHIYIGDFGNNQGNRDDLGIYIVAKEDIPTEGNSTADADHLTFTYEDFSVAPKSRKSNNFDCEALICIEDSLYLFSKNWGDQQTKLYRLPKIPGDYEAELIDQYDVSGLVTGADYNREAKEITLIGYTDNTFVPFFWLLFDYHENRLFSGNKRRIDMLNIAATQTEAIAYTFEKQGAFTSESTALSEQAAYFFSTGTWTDSLPTGLSLLLKPKFEFMISPNPVEGNQIDLTLGALPAGDYVLELYDSMGGLLQIRDYRLTTDRSRALISLQVGELKKGMYFVRLIFGSSYYEQKFIRL